MIQFHYLMANSMTTALFIFWGVALLILIGLGTYAWSLTHQLRTLKQHKQAEAAQAELSLRQYQLGLLQDIQFIARSVLAEQCEITEGVLRLNYLINALDPTSWQHEKLTAVRAHFDACKSMPILEAYKALSRKAQFTLDNERYRLENDHKEAINQDLQWLVTYSFPSVTLLQ